MVSELRQARRAVDTYLANLSTSFDAPISEVLPLFFRHKGQPYSLDWSHYFFEPMFRFKNRPRRQVWRCGRQVAKSASSGHSQVILTTAIPNFNILNCLPFFEQARKFSANVVAPAIRNFAMPEMFLRGGSVLQRDCANDSRMFFASMQGTADRARGISADLLNLDECVTQDTIISCATQNKRIVDVRPGELIDAFNPQTNRPTTDRVVRVVYKGKRPVWRLRLSDGSHLDCTDNEKLWTPTGWLYLSEASELCEAAKCLTTPALTRHAARRRVYDHQSSKGEQAAETTGVRSLRHTAGWQAARVCAAQGCRTRPGPLRHRRKSRREPRLRVRPRPGCDKVRPVARLSPNVVLPARRQWAARQGRERTLVGASRLGRCSLLVHGRRVWTSRRRRRNILDTRLSDLRVGVIGELADQSGYRRYGVYGEKGRSRLLVCKAVPRRCPAASQESRTVRDTFAASQDRRAAVARAGPCVYVLRRANDQSSCKPGVLPGTGLCAQGEEENQPEIHRNEPRRHKRKTADRILRGYREKPGQRSAEHRKVPRAESHRYQRPSPRKTRAGASGKPVAHQDAPVPVLWGADGQPARSSSLLWLPGMSAGQEEPQQRALRGEDQRQGTEAPAGAEAQGPDDRAGARDTPRQASRDEAPESGEFDARGARGEEPQDAGVARLEEVAVVSVEYLGEDDVYDIETERYHTLFANGIAVHNCQDIDPVNIPVAQACYAASPFKIENWLGTPKTFDNLLQVQYDMSSQGVWVTPCHHCNFENYGNVGMHLLQMIDGPTLVCAKCRRDLNTRLGFWEHQYPERQKTFAGYHVPQPLLPMHYEDPNAWQIIQEARQGPPFGMPLYRFYNEILGESYDAGAKLITQKEIQEAAVVEPRPPTQLKRYGGFVIAGTGVDWGGRGKEKTTDTEDFISNTAVAIGGMRSDGIVEVCHLAKVPYEVNHQEEVRMVAEAASMSMADVLALDYGGQGNVMQSMLEGVGCPQDILMPFTYIGHTPRRPIVQYTPPATAGVRSSYTLDKTRSVLLLIELIKSGQVLLPDYETYKHCLADFNAIYEESTDSPNGSKSRRICRLRRQTDDIVHAVNFLVMALYHKANMWPKLAKSFAATMNS